MAQRHALSIREVLLDTIRKEPRSTGNGPMTRKSVLAEAARTLGFTSGDTSKEEALLTEWNELFRTGVLGPGKNLNTPDPPWFHVTKRGRQALENLTRDPSNPAGYLRRLDKLDVPIGSTAKSYVVEALECYIAGLYKAAAVMIGAAAEANILEIRDLVVEVLKAAEKRVPTELNSYKIKTVTDALTRVFQGIDKKTHRELREKFDAHWGALTHEIRKTRNDAGHPSSIDPVTPESVHASLLLFPVLADLYGDLLQWVADDLQSSLSKM